LVEIKSGLKAGEQVITEGADRLKDGAKVNLPGDKPRAPGAGRRGGADRADKAGADGKADAGKAGADRPARSGAAHVAPSAADAGAVDAGAAAAGQSRTPASAPAPAGSAQ
jgi:multidrug efflux system membrane fusion protein